MLTEGVDLLCLSDKGGFPADTGSAYHMVDLSANSTVNQDTAWDCCDVSKEAIETNQAYIYVNKELQRVTKEAVRELDAKDILLIFPEKSKMNTTVLVLKTPKTESSVRKVFLPRSGGRI